jgi:hypothetical protein
MRAGRVELDERHVWMLWLTKKNNTRYEEFGVHVGSLPERDVGKS